MRALPVLVLLLVACAGPHPSIDVHDAYGYEPVLGDVGAVYFTMDNRTAEADTLVGIEVSGAAMAMLHDQGEDGSMPHIEALPLPPHSETRLQPGGLHVMIEGMAHPPVAGDTLTITVQFRRAGAVTVGAPVLAYGTER